MLPPNPKLLRGRRQGTSPGYCGHTQARVWTKAQGHQDRLGAAGQCGGAEKAESRAAGGKVQEQRTRMVPELPPRIDQGRQVNQNTAQSRRGRPQDTAK